MEYSNPDQSLDQNVATAGVMARFSTVNCLDDLVLPHGCVVQTLLRDAFYTGQVQTVVVEGVVDAGFRGSSGRRRRRHLQQQDMSAFYATESFAFEIEIGAATSPNHAVGLDSEASSPVRSAARTAVIAIAGVALALHL